MMERRSRCWPPTSAMTAFGSERPTTSRSWSGAPAAGMPQQRPCPPARPAQPVRRAGNRSRGVVGSAALVAASRGDDEWARERLERGLRSASPDRRRPVGHVLPLGARLPGALVWSAGSCADPPRSCSPRCGRASGSWSTACSHHASDELEALIMVGRRRTPSVAASRRRRRSRAAGSGRLRGVWSCAPRACWLRRGDHDAALEQLLTAERLHGAGRSRSITAALLALGEAQRRAGRRRDARASLQAAAAVFERLGARPWSARNGRELGRLGGRVASGDELTATEQRVASPGRGRPDQPRGGRRGARGLGRARWRQPDAGLRPSSACAAARAARFAAGRALAWRPRACSDFRWRCPSPIAVVGRERELAVIESFLAAEPCPRALVVEGEAGAGKTTLLRAAMTRAPDVQVLACWPRRGSRRCRSWGWVICCARTYGRGAAGAAAAAAAGAGRCAVPGRGDGRRGRCACRRCRDPQRVRRARGAAAGAGGGR